MMKIHFVGGIAHVEFKKGELLLLLIGIDISTCAHGGCIKFVGSLAKQRTNRSIEHSSCH